MTVEDSGSDCLCAEMRYSAGMFVVVAWNCQKRSNAETIR